MGETYSSQQTSLTLTLRGLIRLWGWELEVWSGSRVIGERDGVVAQTLVVWRREGGI